MISLGFCHRILFAQTRYLDAGIQQSNKLYYYCDNRVIISTNYNKNKLKITCDGCDIKYYKDDVYFITPKIEYDNSLVRFYFKKNKHDSIIVGRMNYINGFPEPEIKSISENLRMDSIELYELKTNKIFTYYFPTTLELHTRMNYKILHCRGDSILNSFIEIHNSILPEQVYTKIYNDYKPGDLLILYDIVIMYEGFKTNSSGKSIILK